jgi:hypothetical protein
MSFPMNTPVRNARPSLYGSSVRTPSPYRPPSLFGNSPVSSTRTVRPYRPPSLFGETESVFVPRQLNFTECGEEVNALHEKLKTNKLNLPICGKECECSICMSDDNDNDKGTLPCGHTFHVHCIAQWFLSSKNTCPNCRHVIDVKTLFH